jgi:predicted SnoaL-like aldol condensation-catalyzing enzyme
MKSHVIDTPALPAHFRAMGTDHQHIVQSALTKLAQTGDANALEPFLHESFLHHRPESTLNKAQWLASVAAVPLADLRVEIRHLLADGAFVVMHSTRSLAPNGPRVAGVDIWRVEEGLIAEAWEILEPFAEAADHFVWWKSAPAQAAAQP